MKYLRYLAIAGLLFPGCAGYSMQLPIAATPTAPAAAAPAPAPASASQQICVPVTVAAGMPPVTVCVPLGQPVIVPKA